MLSKLDLEEILHACQTNGADFSEIFIEETRATAITCEDNKIEKVIAGVDAGAGIRLISGNTTYYASTTDLEKENLIKISKELSSAAPAKSMTNKKIDLRPQICETLPSIKRRPNEVSPEEKAALVIEANKIARSYGNKIVQVLVRYADENQAVSIANSNGLYVEDNRIRTRYFVQVIAQKDNILQTGYEAPGAAVGFELIEEYPIEAQTRKAAERAILMLDASHAPTGQMQVVLASEAGGTLIHEACGHGLEADFINKKTSIYAGKVGKKVASELITVIDDPSLPGKYGSFAFDDEGTCAKKNILIENGILKNFMTDYYNAQKLGIPLSSNGRRQSFRHKPIPRMTNTYIERGSHDPKEIIASIKDGLLVKRMGGGEVNVVNGDFVFEITEAYLIKDGKIKHPVRGATLIGNGPKVLEMIDMVGNDLEFQTGVCGKGQHAPVSDAQPTIRIPEITIGGK